MRVGANKESSSCQEDENGTTSVLGVWASEICPQPACVKPAEANTSSSSWSPLKSYFVGMGFSPTLVEKAIEEKGEDNVDLLLETLCTFSEGLQNSSDSFDIMNGVVPAATRAVENTSPAKIRVCENGQEIEAMSDETLAVLMDKRLQLREMGFSEHEVAFVIEKLGEDVPILELADSIFANRFAFTSAHENKAKDAAALELKMEMLQSASVIALL